MDGKVLILEFFHQNKKKKRNKIIRFLNVIAQEKLKKLKHAGLN